MADENLKELTDGIHRLSDGLSVHRTDDGFMVHRDADDVQITLTADQIEDLGALCGRVSQPRPKMYLAYNGRAYAKGFSRTDALARFASHHGTENTPDPVRVMIVEGRGDVWSQQRGTMVGLRGDHLYHAEEFKIPLEKFEDLVRAAEEDQSERAAEAALVEAESEVIDLDE